MQSTKGDDWKSLAAEYGKRTAEVTSESVEVMLERSNHLWPFSEATGVLDNGCGPGVIMGRILRAYKLPPTCGLTCSDYSAPMIEQVENTKAAAEKEDGQSPWPRVKTVVQDAMDLQSIADSSMSHVTAGLVYFMLPQPQKALRESLRVLQDGGVLACSSWEGSQWIDLMRMTTHVRSDAAMPDFSEDWTDAGRLKAQLEKVGFRDVESHRIHVQLKFEKLDELVDFFITSLPNMKSATKEFSEAEMGQLKTIMYDEGRKMVPADPGSLSGVALVAVGRK